MKSLFITQKNTNKMDSLNVEQKLFADYLLECEKIEKREMIIVNSPGGTGKTFTIKILKQYLKVLIYILAPTNKAVSLFKESHLQAQTIHRFLNAKSEYDLEGDIQFNFGLPKLTRSESHKYHMIIVDECSMVDSHMFLAFQKYLQDYNCLICFMGDNFQIPPVNERLSIVFHQKFKIFTFVQNMRTMCPQILESTQFVRETKSLSETIFSVIRLVPLDQAITEFSKCADTVYLTWTNKKKEDVSHTVRKKMFCSAEIPKFMNGERLIFSGYRNIKEESWWYETDHAKREKTSPDAINYESTAVLAILAQSNCLCRNARVIIYYSNDIIRITQIEFVELRVFGKLLYFYKLLDQNNNIWLSPREESFDTVDEVFKNKRQQIKNMPNSAHKKKEWWNYHFQKKLLFPDLDYSYAMTVHKAQGSQWETVLVDVCTILRSIDKNQLLYTAVSRAIKKLIYTN